MKKPAMFMAAGLVGLLAITGCSSAGDSATPADPDEVSGDITFWTYPIGPSAEASFWEPIVDRFQEEYPNVNVDVVIQPFEGREQQIVTSIAGNAAPDVIYFNPDFIPKFVGEDVLLPLDDVIEGDDDFRQAALDAMSYDDTLYGVPILMAVYPVTCNTAVLDAAGVACPTTWDEVREIAPVLKDAGFYTTQYEGALDASLNNTFYPYLLQAGGQILNDDMTAAAFNSPEGVEALQFLVDMADEGYLPQQNLTSLDLLEQSPAGLGEVAFVAGTNPGSLSPIIGEENTQISAALTDKDEVAVGTVAGYSVFSSTEAPDASKAWVKFLTSEEEMGEFDTAIGFHAPRESLKDLYEADTVLGQTAQYLDTAWVGLLHPQAREIMSLISPHLQSALLGKQTAQEALDAAAAEVDELLKRS